MLQFDFIPQRPKLFCDLAFFVTSILVSLSLIHQAPQKVNQESPVSIKIFSQTQWIDTTFFLHFLKLMKRTNSSRVRIKKLVICPSSITLSGLVFQQQAFYDFWQVLKDDSKVVNVDLLHWYGQGKSFHFDVRASLR